MSNALAINKKPVYILLTTYVWSLFSLQSMYNMRVE